MSSEESSSASASSSSSRGSTHRRRRVLKPKKALAAAAASIEHPYERAPLHELGPALLLHASQVKNRLVDCTVDCKPYSLCTAIMGSMYAYVYATVLVVLFGLDEGTARVSAQVPVGQPLPTPHVLAEVRTQLIEAALKYGHMINTRTRISGRDCSALDNLAKLILMIDAVVFYADDRKRALFEGYTAEDDEWIVENNLAIDTRSQLVDGTFDPARTPVLSYRMSQFMTAVKQISNQWRSVRWDDRLGVYVDVMRVRAGMFLLCTYNSVVHDIAELCEGTSSAADPEGEYQVNALFAGTVYDVFLDLIKDVAQFAAYARMPRAMAYEVGALVDDEDEWADLKRRVINWVERKLTVMVATSESTNVSRYLLKMDMRPGERAGYAREFTQRLADDSSIIQKYREVDFNELCMTKKRMFVDILREDLVVPYKRLLEDRRPRFIREELFPPEPPHVCLSLLEMIDSHLTSNFFGLKWSDFWIAEPDMHKRGSDLGACDWPLLVQAFNHWHLYYNGLVRCDSFLKALICWLRVVEHHRRGKLHTWDISAWISDIASMGERQSGCKSLFKENNESGGGSSSSSSDESSDADSESDSSSSSSSSSASSLASAPEAAEALGAMSIL